ncbi:hypothetical protein KUL150_10130 [Alteromonas sp. KUL150]|uniref:hypothetical protein n=1 Tax=Alteromonas sp. KUL150 TaxID=2480805 RepID=UPI0012E44031|nr:hypothetical protein [Alteromonas sp. KUL150]GFD84954.1 hypothetical protein KUL150_10130 [Alteromonas sp. KUL150]
MRKAWIKFWFNDYTRVIGVFFGGHLLITGPWAFALLSFFDALEHFRNVIWFLYSFILLWAMLDNDYTKLDDL